MTLKSRKTLIKPHCKGKKKIIIKILKKYIYKKNKRKLSVIRPKSLQYTCHILVIDCTNTLDILENFSFYTLWSFFLLLYRTNDMYPTNNIHLNPTRTKFLK